MRGDRKRLKKRKEKEEERKGETRGRSTKEKNGYERERN